jgi:predicted ATPase/transcriptional regulator with XRE-family HTH domain
MDQNGKKGKFITPNHLLQKERQLQGWSQKDLADLLNVPDSRNIGRWERGETFPHPHYRRELCRVFGKSMEELGLLIPSARAQTPRMAPPPLTLSKLTPFWNVPASFTPCLGRTQEITALTALLGRADLRLLTVLGPGGSGKTRLVEEVAQQMRARFAGGVCFVSLHALGDASLVLPAIAQELHIQESGNETLLARLHSLLLGKELLLILDGFERVEEAAPLVGQMLAACADLRVLVTSQVPLHLRAEQEFPLASLALPARDLLTEPERLVSYASLELFARHAQIFLPSFRLSRANARTIAEICLHLDGLPLAIELAAANLKMFAPQILLTQILQRRFKVLVDGRESLASHGANLYGTIKWSYDLLNTEEQWFFRHLAVFADGCSLEAIEGLCQLCEREACDVLALTRSLIDRSLLQQHARQEANPCFTMLETLREFGIDCLRRAGEWEAGQQAHAEYYLTLVEQAGPHLKAAAQTEWLERLECEKENLRTALNWLLSVRKTEQALRFCENFGKFCGLRGYWSEELYWLQAVLQQAQDVPPTKTYGRVLRRAGHLAYRLRDLANARRWLEQSVTLSQDMEDFSNLAGSLSGLGWVLYRQKKIVQAGQLLHRSREVARLSQDTWALANTLESLGRFFCVQGQFDKAQELATESVQLARTMADKENLARLLCTLVTIELAQGEMERAEASAWESYGLAREIGNTPLIALALDGLARVVFCQEEFESAKELYERCLELARQLDDRSAFAGIRLKLSEIALRQGDLDLGETLVEESLKFLREQGDDPNIAIALCLSGDIRCLHRHFAQAIPAYRQALRLEQEIGEKETIGRSLIGLARVLLAQKRAEVATRLLGFAGGMLGPAGKILYLTLATDYQRALQEARTQLGPLLTELELARGRALDYEAILALCD